MFFSKNANGNFTVVNTYDVLLNLLKHWGARIIYWKHIFYIVQIQEYNTEESGTYANPDNINTRTYTKTGAFDSSSDNLGDSYWTRYNLLIDDVTGSIQKLTGTQFNYLPQLKRTQANFLDYGNKNYFGGIPFDITTGQTDVILQDTFEDVSSDGAMLLIIPLDVTIVQQYNGSLSLRILFRLFITDGATTYYLRYDPTNTPKFYWESSTTVNLNNNQTRWYSTLDNLIGTQTKVGFHELIEFKDSGGSAITLSGEWKAYIDIDNWGVSNTASSFYFYASVGGIGGTNTQVYEPSLTTVYYTNTLNASYQTPLNPVVIGTTSQQTTGMTGTSYNYTSNNIINYQTSLNINPFEGKFLIVKTTGSGAIYGSQVMVTPQTTTSDVEVVDFGDLIWGDTLLASSEGSLKVWNGSAFVKSNVTGTWGLGSTSGTNSFTEMLLSEYLFGQTKVVESPSMQLVIGETNKNQNDGSGSRPNFVNPIGRLIGYSATGSTPRYIFKSGSFHLLRDEIDYQGYQIIRDVKTVTTTDDIIIGADVLQDKTNKVGQKTPESNTLAAKLTQNSFITTISSTKSAYGNNIAVNGIFSSDSSWTKGTGWSIASNKATFATTGSTSEIKQDILTNALTYKIVVSVSVSAGGLSVKAGSSGSATVLSVSGTYEIFSTCSGSTDVIFEASAAFEGYIEKVVVQQQVPITSININAIGTAVFKANDVLNIANFDGNEINEFTVSSDQGASDTSIAVTSKLITEDILEGSIILVNQNDLAAQYQNKTKGTVAGFTIDADGIAKGGVEITGWLDSDTMSGATANNVPTAESVKAYVDTQVGSADTLAEVLALGNTTGGTDISVNDDDKLKFGASSDFKIYHNSTLGRNLIDNDIGDLYITQSANDKDIILRCDDGAGGVAAYITLDGSAGFTTVQKNIKFEDSVQGRFGNGSDLRIFHDGSHSEMNNHTGHLSFINYADDKDIIFKSDNGSGGVAEYFRLDGGLGYTVVSKLINFSDNVSASWGAAGDLSIRHDGADNLIAGSNGHIYITNSADDKDIILRSDDGSGGVAEYFRLDGGLGYTVVSKLINFSDNVSASWGAAGDLSIRHDGADNLITGSNGHIYITNSADDKDIIFRSDDGSGGVTAYITLDGSQTTINLQQNVLIGTTTDSGNKLDVNGDVMIQNSSAPNFKIYRSGTGQLWNMQIDSSGRLQIKEAASLGGTQYTRLQIDDSGEVEVYNTFTGTTANFSGNMSVGGTAGAVYKLDVVGKQRVQSVLELDDVLTLNAISTPSDPASGKSSIYMDSSDGAIKCKINVGGSVVTRTIASFE